MTESKQGFLQWLSDLAEETKETLGKVGNCECFPPTPTPTHVGSMTHWKG